VLLRYRSNTERLVSQRRVSPATIASYRDSLKLLLAFARQRTGKTPNALDWADLDAELITALLDHLEAERHNNTGTRNLRSGSYMAARGGGDEKIVLTRECPQFQANPGRGPRRSSS
jgi:hypothetical protein